MGNWGFIGGLLLGVALGVVGLVLAMAAGLLDIKRPPGPSPTKEWGEFLGSPPKVELLEDGRSIRLLADFTYVDARQKVWLAKKEAVANGASIPRVFWSVTGGPLEGQYRDASIIHDEACRERLDSSGDVHLAFYEACRCSGVPEKQAKILYMAVYHFGPQWEVERVMEAKESIDKKGKKVRILVGKRVPKAAPQPREPDKSDLMKVEGYVEAQNPSLEEIRRRSPSEL
jgi:Protein of unknown function (DUF1353).